MVADDNRVRIRKDVHEALQRYVKDEWQKISGVPGVKIDENYAATDIIMNFLADKGYLPSLAKEGDRIGP